MTALEPCSAAKAMEFKEIFRTNTEIGYCDGKYHWMWAPKYRELRQSRECNCGKE